MGFHEDAIFPTGSGSVAGLAPGSRGGPGFKSFVFEGDSGHEEVVSRWEEARHRFNGAYNIRTQADVFAVKTFYMARRGSAFGFRMLDWSDFATGENGVGAVAFTDMILGTADGAATTFQLSKQYIDGGVTRERTILKPIDGTVVIGKDAVEITSGWTLDPTTGLITFSTPPSAGTLTWGGQFHVPCRFGQEADVLLDIEADEGDVMGIDDIPIIEMKADTEVHHGEFFFGGSKEWGIITGDVNLTLLQGRVHTTEQTAAGLKGFLPNADPIPTGGPHFYYFNDGTTSFSIRNPDDTELVAVSAGNSVVIVLSVDSTGNKTWRAK